MARLTPAEQAELELLEALEGEERAAQRRQQKQMTHEDGGPPLGPGLGPSLRGLAKGVTLGFDDEIQGAVESVVTDKTYGEAVAGVRERDAAARQARPGAFAVGEMVGGTATAAVPVGGAISRAKTLGGKMFRGGSTGAVVGAVQGAANADPQPSLGFVPSFHERRDGAAQMWAPGAVMGAAAPVVGKAAGGLFGLTKPAPRAAQELGYGKGASRVMETALREDMAGDPKALERLRSYGDEGMLMDMGPAAQGRAGAAASVPGDAKAIIARAVNERHDGRAGRVTQAVDGVAGEPRDMAEGRLRMMEARAEDGRTFYEPLEHFAAEGGAIDPVPVIRHINGRLETAKGPVREALLRARTMLLRPGGGMDTNPVGLHNARSTLAAMASGRGFNQPLDSVARELRGVAGEIDRLLDDAVPGYANARAVYGGQSRVMEAADDGQDFLKSSVRPNALRIRWAEMSEAERAAYRAGARDAIEAKMSGAVNEDRAAMSFAGPRSVREKMDIIFGPGAGDEIAERVATEKAFAEGRNRAVGNTLTAERVAGQAELAPFRTDPHTGNAPSTFGRARAALMDRPVNAIINAHTRPGPDEMRSLAKGLTATGAERERLIQALLSDVRKRGAREGRAEAVAPLVEALTRGVGRGAVQTYSGTAP